MLVYSHPTVNHSLTFMDPVTATIDYAATHTQHATAELSWNEWKSLMSINLP